MTTNFPLGKDSYSTKVDNVDDVMAAHINNPQDAIEAIEDLRDYSLTRVKNTSGAAVVANDVGYIDGAGEFKLTTTAYLGKVQWAVVIAGAANNANIIVAKVGRVTVILDGNCGIGDYLYTSTTTKQATTETYVRPEVLGVALTANTGGAGGTCEALLLTNRIPHIFTDTNYLVRVNSSSDSDWTSTQNGAPAGAVITYNVALTAGAEDAIVPVSASDFAKHVLHNTTRGETALIDSVNIGANTITVTDADDVTDWVNTNVLEVRSQTNTDNPQAGVYFFDVEMEDTVVIPVLTVALCVFLNFKDTGAASQVVTLHPYETGASSKRKSYGGQVANVYRAMADMWIGLNQRRFCLARQASGAGTKTTILGIQGILVAAP